MRVPSLNVRFVASTLLCVLLLAALTMSGCASRSAGPSTASAVGTEQPAEVPSVEPRDETDRAVPPAPAAAAPTDTPEALEDPAEEPFDGDDALPGEEVTRSPIDQLADVSPELDPKRLEDERERAESLAPSYDIPMVTNDRVLFWLDFYSNRRRADFEAGLVRSGRYMHLFRRVFEEEGVPLDLIYMAQVESGYKTTAYSRAHARGIFQFMAATGRRYGLRIDYWVDERLDPEKSARASAAYLRDLYEEFHDWYLALAAYNAGEGKIRRALRKSGRNDFWGIAQTRYIRRETKNHVPAILAAVMISKDPESYGFDIERDAPVLYETVEIDGAVDLQVLSRCAGTDASRIKKLNPALRRDQTPPHATTSVRLPPGTSSRTLAALSEIPVSERVLYVRHQVRGGDTLYDLARAYGVTVPAIQQANRMGRRTMIRVGDELTIPTAGAVLDATTSAAVIEPANAEALTYRVRRGDTLSSIGRRYGTSASAVASASGISVYKTLQIGERLTVVPGARFASASRPVTLRQSGVGGAIVHTVQRGDSLWRIAREYDTTVSEICSLNRISRHKTLYPGTRLTISAP